MLPSGEIRTKDELINNPAGADLAGRLKSSVNMIQRAVERHPRATQIIASRHSQRFCATGHRER